jgi:hypothetical protein
MTRGGYRQPNNPAPVSGPGMLSKRTDGGATEGMSQPVQQYTGGAYGQNKALREQQSAESMYATPELPAIPELDAPTNYKNEDISHGANWNPNTPGLKTAGIRGLQPPTVQNTVYNAMQYDKSGQLEAIYNRLNQ